METAEIHSQFTSIFPDLVRVFTARWGQSVYGEEKVQEALCHSYEFFQSVCKTKGTPPPKPLVFRHSTCRVNGYRRFADRKCDWTNLGTEACTVFKGKHCMPLLDDQPDIWEANDKVLQKTHDPTPYELALFNVDFRQFMQDYTQGC